MAFKQSDEFLDAEHLLSDSEKDGRGISRRSSTAASRARFLPYSVALNIVLAIAVGLAWMFSTRQRRVYIPNVVYCSSRSVRSHWLRLTLLQAPAQSAVEYKTVVFTGGLHGDKSPYQGSSDEVNARWNELYNGM